MEMFVGKSQTYTVEDTNINVAYNCMSEHDVRMYAVRMNLGEFNDIMQLSFSSVEYILHGKGHIVKKETKLMGMYKQRHDVPYSNTDGPDVELRFSGLIEMSYDDLLDMYNDYKQMYAAFNDYNYRVNSDIVMAALLTKGAKEVSVS